ncbi:MAG: hypothetical protein KF732_06245 [Flavobacteriales bacterium]|nr:hypothetical protein [Flavobacteriales bacterium]
MLVQKDNNIKNCISGYFPVKSIRFILLALWIFSFFNISFISKTSLFEQNQSTLNDYICVFSSENINPYSNLPFGPNSPEKPEEFNENENKVNLDDDWQAILTVTTLFNPSFFKVQTLQKALSLQNRKTIPLFILFHSWKSFLF